MIIKYLLLQDSISIHSLNIIFIANIIKRDEKLLLNYYLRGLEEAEGVEEDAEDGDGADVAQGKAENAQKRKWIAPEVGKLVAQVAAVDFPSYEDRTDKSADWQTDVGRDVVKKIKQCHGANGQFP